MREVRDTYVGIGDRSDISCRADAAAIRLRYVAMKIPLLVLAIASLVVIDGTASAQTTPIVIKASTVLDGKGGTLRNVAIVVQGSKIVRIEPAQAGATYDLTALTVMPGWIDTHAHIIDHFNRSNGRLHTDADPETLEQTTLYAYENAYKTFMAGFTTLQSPGNPVDKDIRDWINDGRVPGPRILTSIHQIFDNTGTPDQIRMLIDKWITQEGADFVKIFASGSIRAGGLKTMTDEQIQAACGEANKLGKRTIVHAQGPDSAKSAILAGCTAIEHGNRLTDEDVALMVQHGTYFDSNNHLMIHNYLDNKAHFIGIGNYTEEGYAYMERGLAAGNESFKKALAGHVKMVFGTDATAGAHGRNAEEFIGRVKEGGQAPMDAIVSATSTSAESLRLDKQIGTIAPGMEADIIATDGNPLQDITAVRRVAFIMKGGKVFKNEMPASKTTSRRTN
jgi:imidazolonepropionase-like amidohydrolase